MACASARAPGWEQTAGLRLHHMEGQSQASATMTFPMRSYINVQEASTGRVSVLLRQIHFPVVARSSLLLNLLSLMTATRSNFLLFVACHSPITALDGAHGLYNSLCFNIAANFFGRPQHLSLVEQLF